MRIRERSLNRIGTVTVVALIAGVLVTAAIRAEGYKADHVTLHDNGIWVTKQDQIGRFNFDLQKVDTKSVGFQSPDVQQIDGTVVVTTASKMFSYDVAMNQSTSDGMSIHEGTVISIGGSNGALLDVSDHKLWFTDRDTVAAVKTDVSTGQATQGAVTLPDATMLKVGTDGIAHAIAPSSGTIWTLRTTIGIGTNASSEPATESTTNVTSPPISAAAPTESLPPSERPVATHLKKSSLSGDGLQLTTAGSHAVMLLGKTLILDSDVSFMLPSEVGTNPRLQQPSADPAHVLIAADNGLSLLDLATHKATPLFNEVVTGAIDPLWLDGCAYGAWHEKVFGSCSSPTSGPLPAWTVEPKFRTNRGHVALNFDDGTLLAFQQGGATNKVDNTWSDALDPSKKNEAKQLDQPDTQPNQCKETTTNTKPSAPDTSFNVRPGQSSELDVLTPPTDDRNKRASDVDCDVLTVALPEGGGIDPKLGELALIRGGRAFQYIPPDPAPTSPITFNYVVSDGHQDGVVTATATINVLAADAAGTPPHAVADSSTVEVGKTVVIDVLANDWDAEGDTLRVTSAALKNVGDGALVWQPSGRLAYTAAGSGSGTKTVEYSIQDDHGDGLANGTLDINVIAPGVNAPPNLLSDSVAGMLGPPEQTTPREFSVNVLANDSDPNGDSLRVVEVHAYGDTAADLKPTHDDSGVVTFAPTTAGSYTFIYSVDDGHGASVASRLRFDISPYQGEVAPVAVKDSMVLNTSHPTVIDVLRNDTDLNGDVLMVTDFAAIDVAQQDLNVEIVDHRLLRISAKRSVLAQPTYRLNYTVSDGTLTAHGTVIANVVSDQSEQAPITIDDRAQVHQGGYVSLPVLANDFDPNGNPLTLTSAVLDDKVAAQGDPGQVFVQGDQLRYLAPTVAAHAQPFTATGTYTISNGRESANGRFTIDVTDPTNNRAPNPTPLELRTYAGQEATLTLPSSGMDPDGDVVELVVRTDSPSKGTVDLVEGTTFVYQPNPGETGADSFRYQIRDTYGQIGYLTVRVVIAAVPSGNRAPVAVNDVAQVLPGQKVSIPVLANDTDPDPASAIDFVPTRPFDQPNTGAGTVAAGPAGYLDYSAPATLGSYSFNYYITDGNSAPVQGLVTVTVTNTIVNRAPIVKDVVLGPHRPGDIVQVDLVKYASDPDGDIVSFRPGLDGEAIGATVDATKVDAPKLSFTMGKQQMLFTFKADDGKGGVSRGVVTVPLPVNQAPTADRIEKTMEAEQPDVQIDIPSTVLHDPENDTVVIKSDSHPTVSPTQASSADIVWAGNGFVFHRNPDFGGTAIITYYISDQPKFGDPIVAPATVVITIKPKLNKPPVVNSASLDVIAGATQSFDLSKLASDPDPGDNALLKFGPQGTWSAPNGITLNLSGPIVTFTASIDSIKKGGEQSVPYVFTADDGKPSGNVSATLTVTFKPNSLPAPQAVDDQEPSVKQTDSPPTWNLIGNDPPNGQGPYTIVAVSSPVNGTVSIVGTDSVKFTPTPGTSGTTSFTYTIQDIRKDPGFSSTAKVTVSVEDKPAAPQQPTVGAQLSTTAVVSFIAPAENGAPIDNFEVQGTPGGKAQCVASPCTVNGLQNGTPYTFMVRAHNAVGWSDWSSNSSPPYTPDELPGTPPTPQADWGNASATVTWGNIPNAGSPIRDVTVSVSPPDVAPRVHAGGATGGQETFTGLKNDGTSYTFTITARNDKGSSLVSQTSAGVVPAGPPTFDAVAPSIVASNGFVDVSWPAAHGNGDNNLTYTVKLTDNGSNAAPVVVGATLSAHIPATNGHFYRATITAFNKYSVRFAPLGVDSLQSAQAKPIGPAFAPMITSASAGSGDGTVQLTWSAADPNGGTLSGYQVSISGGSAISVGLVTSVALSGNGMSLGGGPYSFRVLALNDNSAGTPGDWSLTKGSVSPYTPPAQPYVYCYNSGNTINCDWHTNAINGPSNVSVSSSVQGAVGTSGTMSFGDVGYSASRSLTITVCNGGNNGNNCSANSSSASTPAPPRVVSTSKGPLYGTCQVGGGSCYYVNISVSGFSPGNHTFYCFGGASIGNPGKVYSGTIGVGGNGNGYVSTSNTAPNCAAANSVQAAIVIDGVGDSGSW